MNKLTWTNVTVRLGDLKPWADNPRFSTKAQAERLLQSFKEFGQVQTVAVGPALEVYDGHQRLSALLTIYGPDHVIDARQSDRPLTDEERRKLVVTLHAGAVGAWDWDTLSSWDSPTLIDWGLNTDALKDWKRDVTALDSLLKAEQTEPVDAEPQIARAEELRHKWGVETGDLWQIGEHRLICGDSAKREDVERVMGGEMADVCVTDPPYGVLDEEWDRLFSQEDLDGIFSVTSGMVACFNAAKPEILLHMLSLSPIPQRVGVWRYSQIVPKPGMIWSWQPVFYWNCKEAKAWDSLDWYQGNSDKDGTHPTQKPVAFFEKIIGSVECATVYEPFSGSGTTIIACENLHRKCRAVEISPAYVAVALERMATAFPDLTIVKIENE